MAITLQNTINWAQPFVRFMPLNIGTSNEPSITNANIIQQTILGAPFVWNWNRKTLSITTIAGTQDYNQAIGDFGFLEKASITSGSTTFELSNTEPVLGDGAERDRPHTIAPQIDDNNGHLSFRLLPIPDAVYTVKVIYQAKAPVLTSLSDSWAIPDRFAYIFNRGFLALSFEYADDPKFQVENQKFVSALLGAAEGLSEQSRNVFLGHWLSVTGQTASGKSQQGLSSRGQ